MLQSLRQKVARDNEDGFTLIELMVVVLIIAILIAIAIPTFLGARQRAQNRAAQSNLRNVLTAEKTFYTDAQAYTATAADMTAIEPSITYGAGTAAPAVVGTVNLAIGDTVGPPAVTSAVVCLTAKSASGDTYALGDIAAGTNAGTYYFKAVIGASCTEALVAAGVKTGF